MTREGQGYPCYQRDMMMMMRSIRCNLLDFALSVDHKLKMKEEEKTDKKLELAREVKKLIVCLGIMAYQPL